MANVLDCKIIVSEFELQSRYYVQALTYAFRKKFELLSLQEWVK